jgi:hypothetical protein
MYAQMNSDTHFRITTVFDMSMIQSVTSALCTVKHHNQLVLSVKQYVSRQILQLGRI